MASVFLRMSVFIVAVFCLTASSDSFAVYGSGACSGFCLEDYDSCGADGSLNDIVYACDEAYNFVEKCDYYDCWRRNRYASAYWDMFVEDKRPVGACSGNDWWTVDDSIGENLVVFWSGHGYTDVDHAPGERAYFKGDTCGICSLNFFTNIYNMVLGETSGGLATPYPGWARILILSTCHGLELNDSTGTLLTDWGDVISQSYGRLITIMSFDNTKMFGPTTDELGEDFVQKAMGSGWTLRSAWFYAVDDWYFDNKGVIFTWDPNCLVAQYLVQNMLITTTYLVPGGAMCKAVSYHVG